MSSTVTTSAVYVVNTGVLLSSLGLIVAMTLLALLIWREVTVFATVTRSKTLARTFNVAIVPLLMGIAMTFAVQLAQVILRDFGGQ